MKLIFHIAIFLLFTVPVFSQNITVSDYRGELNIKIEVIDEKRIEKGVETLNEAILVEKEAIRMLKALDDTIIMLGESSDYKKMIRKFLDASELFGEGHFLIYSVFDENCEKFQIEMKKMNHYASGLNKAKYYERKGKRNIARAIDIREILPEADKPEWIQYKMHEAFQLEKLSIRDKGRALQIYQDFPVEYNYGWENDITPEELEKFFNNPLVKLPPEDVFKRKPVEERKEPEGGEVVFRVQIAAHTVTLTDDYIRTFYTGKDSVIEINEGKWYKYQIGSFDNFREANKLRISSRVPRAFVVAYQDGKKLTIKEALAIIQDN
jgi:hypothetical protein